MTLLLFQHAYLSISISKLIIYIGDGWSRVASSSLDTSSSISSLGLTKGGPGGILIYQSMSGLLHLARSATSGYIWVEYFQFHVDISGGLCIFFYYSSPLVLSQVSSRTCHRSIQTYSYGFSLLEWGSLASLSSQHVGSYYLFMSYCKRLGALGLQMMHVTLCLLIDVCCTNTGSLSQSGIGKDDWSINNNGLCIRLERMDRLVCSRGCIKNATPTPQQADLFLKHLCYLRYPKVTLPLACNAYRLLLVVFVDLAVAHKKLPLHQYSMMVEKVEINCHKKDTHIISMGLLLAKIYFLKPLWVFRWQ